MAIQAQLYSENIAMGGTQDFFSDNACGFNNYVYIPQQHKEHESVKYDQLSSFSNQKSQNQESIGFSQSIYAQIEKQRIEIDRFLCLQNEKLKMTLQEQRKQQLALFAKKYEAKTQYLLKQKEDEITKAKNRTLELEDYLKRLEIENQTWQRLARNNEATVQTLNNTIQRLRANFTSQTDDVAEDAESCCGDFEENEKKTEDEEKILVCKSCRIRVSNMIMLPCRHMCSCKDCEAFLDSCPVCSKPKRASIEALF